MTRTQLTVVLAALLLAGTALGQAPPWMVGPSANGPALPEGFNAPPVVAVPPHEAAPVLAGPVAGPPATGYTTWGGLRYMLGWTRGDSLPALVTASPAGTPRATAGVGGQPQTSVLFGGNDVNRQARSGVLGEAGCWFDAEQKFGIEGSFLFLGGAATSFVAASNGSPILARPFIDANTDQRTAHLIAFPGDALGSSAGSVRVSDTANRLYGFNVDLRENVIATPVFRLDCLLGYRFLNYAERLDIVERVQATGGPAGAGTTVQSSDRFATRNVFNGIDIGLRADWCYGGFSVGLLGKIAGGHLNHDINISGVQQVTAPGGGTSLRPVGLLAQASNAGKPGSHSWTFLPEVGVTVGYDVTTNLRVTAGYSALWLLNAVRPGLEVDTTLNPNLFPPPNGLDGPTRPVPFPNRTSALWVQGVTAGLEIRY